MSDPRHTRSPRRALPRHGSSANSIEYLGVRSFDGWDLKRYAVIAGSRPLDESGLEEGLRLATGHLPRPPVADGRLGVGFVIAHQGATGDYVVLAWWDNENELPVRVLVRRPGGQWRNAETTESVCVWDLEIIWHERQAWVETVLATGDPTERNTYLSRALSHDPLPHTARSS